MTTTMTPGVRLAALPPAVGRAGLRGALASEFTKLRSVRSTYWTLAALLVVSIGLDAAITAGQAAQFNNNPWNVAGFDATQTSLAAFFEIGQLIIAVLGAMVITSEYSTGMIRTSLTAQPRRGVVYAAKAIVFTAVTLVDLAGHVVHRVLPRPGADRPRRERLAVPHRQDPHRTRRGSASAGAGPSGGGGGGPGRARTGSMKFIGTNVITPGTVLAAIIGTALFVTLVALIAYGVGALVRHTAGAIAIVIALMFIIPILENALPSNWHNDISGSCRTPPTRWSRSPSAAPSSTCGRPGRSSA